MNWIYLFMLDPNTKSVLFIYTLNINKHSTWYSDCVMLATELFCNVIHKHTLDSHLCCNEFESKQLSARNKNVSESDVSDGHTILFDVPTILPK